MITYKIRDKENNEYKNDMIADSEWNVFWIHKNWYFVDYLAFADQSRYTIEQEISDDVIDKIWEDMPWNMNYWEKDELKKSIKKHLNQ